MNSTEPSNRLEGFRILQDRMLPEHDVTSCDGFLFTVVYREQTTIVEVVAIAHGRRKPGYWKERLKI